ncbi:MAG: hypothetical protein QNJ47_27035 [Nostocaceae cyanobacterium]|nr:hypothetical protein [Nostocaceae cyanobacterium]
MAELTLSEVFGTGSTKLASGETVSESGLFIPDSVLSAVGLDSPSTATADAHATAILLVLESNLTQEAFDADVDKSIYAERCFPQFISRGTERTPYRFDFITFNIAKLDFGAILNPNDY